MLALYIVDFSVAPSPPGAFGELLCTVSPVPAGTRSSTHIFTTQPFTSYYLQVGGAAGAGGAVGVALTCTPGTGASPCFFGAVVADTGDDDGTPDIGGPVPPPSAGVGPPDTGSGGYLRPSRGQD